MADDADRKDFAAPHRTGRYAGLDLQHLDPDDDDDRRLLIESEHPEYWDALEDDSTVVDAAGEEISPHIHITLHEVVAAQLLADDPPEMWTTAQRLLSLGYERHEVLHMLATVVSDDIFAALKHRQSLDERTRRRRLDALPESWEALRDPGSRPRNRAERRADRRRQH